VQLAQAAADAGADLIYAHGTHVPGPRGSVRASDGRLVPVLWSLGNLVAVMEEPTGGVHDPAPSVRDALLARVHVRPQGARLAIASIDPEPFWIAAPERAWTRGASPMVRPLSLRGELARIAEASCGARCERYARSYRERERMLAQLMGATVDTPRPATATATAAAPAADTRAPRARPPRPIEGALGRGVPLRVAFAPGAAVESSCDEDQIRELVAMMRADGALHLEITARSARGDARSLASARAHRARGLIAIRGPSRSRIAVRTIEPGDDARLTVRVLRAP